MQSENYQVEDEPKLALGFLAGLTAALIGALLWAIITLITNFQIGFMAVGVGLLVGLAVRQFGNGEGPIFGIRPVVHRRE